MRLSGRVLYLTEDRELVRRQLAGENLSGDPGPLRDNVSTDEITPGWACFHYDDKLGDYCLVGLAGGVVEPCAVRRGGFEVMVSGLSKGCGSSRETAPFAERACGIRLVFARTIEKTYQQNAHNLGMMTSTDFALLARLLAGEDVPIDAFVGGLDPISRAVVTHGGLLGYANAVMGPADRGDRGESQERAGPATSPPTKRRGTTSASGGGARTAVEKIIASHAASTTPSSGGAALDDARPGRAGFVRADIRFSHEYVTPMADALFRRGFGENATVFEPGSVYLFRDHLTLLESVGAESPTFAERCQRARDLASVQDGFARRHRLSLYGEVQRSDGAIGSEAICHNKVVEALALPGQIVVGSDSHTSTAGALGCFAFGVGSTDMAFAWRTGQVRISVPETLRVELRGYLRRGVAAKDVMLHLASLPFLRQGGAIGRVLEFTGEGISALSIDERATLANMAVEVGATTAIIEPDAAVVDYLVTARGLDAERVREQIVVSDPGATYAGVIAVDLATLSPMVALPGDPRSAVAIEELARHAGGEVTIDIAYGGSCTGGKKSDFDAYATVLRRAFDEGRKVAPGVRLYLQFGSQVVRSYAEEQGYLEVFRAVGAQIVEPACGACIGAGPGVSVRPDEVTVSAMSRNFPGRSGPGKMYLASPWVVAASALAGRIVAAYPPPVA